MIKEELKQEAYEYAIKEIPFIECITQNDLEILVQQAYITGAEPREKRIEELEEKISVLLSCKNCPENKGGFICQKEYEDKCLAQKIQYIKELQEENKNLKKTYSKQRNKRIDDLQKKNAELDCQKNRNKFCYSCANATEKCFKNEIGCPCDKYKSYKEENAELKEQLKLAKEMPYSAVKKFAEEKTQEQLTKAKDHIKKLLGCLQQDTNDPQTNYYVVKYMTEAEQFLKDSEVEK